MTGHSTCLMHLLICFALLKTHFKTNFIYDCNDKIVFALEMYINSTKTQGVTWNN